MRLQQAIDARFIPPYGMGICMRTVRRTDGTMSAWRESEGDRAWITYGPDEERVRMVAQGENAIEIVRTAIEIEARQLNLPATIGWEVAYV